MPSFNSKVQLSTAAKNSNTVLSDIDRIKGAFKVYTADDMNAAHVNYFTDGQIVYVSDSGSLYKASVQLADPGNGIFEDSVSFSEFSFVTGSFVSASFDDSSNVLTLFGESLIGSTQVSSSVDLSSLSGGGASIPDGTISSSAQVVSSLPSGTISGSAQVVSSLPSGTISGSAQVETIIDDTYISASAAASGFGEGGASVGTLQQVTDQGNTTDVSMSIMDIEIFSNTVTDLNNSYSGSIYIGANVVSGSDLTPITSKNHTIIGADAGRNLATPSFGLTALGHSAMKGKDGSTGGGGSGNTAIGAFSLFDIDQDTFDNTAIGYNSLLNMESGSGNVAIGARVAFNVIQLQDSVVIGSNALPVGDGRNQIVIGTNAVGSGSNTVTIGNGEITDNYFTGNLTGSIDDVFIAGWGSVSASLASLGGSGGDAAGDITSVVAGNGISGGASTGDATITLDTSSAHFINAVNELGLFSQTGSVFSTTNDLQITGSVTIGDGLLKLKEYTTLPSVEAGGIAYSGSRFYFGID